MPLKQKLDAIIAAGVSNSLNPIPAIAALMVNERQTLYGGAKGRAAGAAAMGCDTVICLMSCTKAITSTICLILAERGIVELDAPAARYLPELDGAAVLKGFGANGKPHLRKPKTKLTLRHLRLHQGGFSYELFSPLYLRFMGEQNIPERRTGKKSRAAHAAAV